MDNDHTVARCVAAELERGEWLRFVTTGNLPGKPNGSAVVHVTRTVVGVAQLTEQLDQSPGGSVAVDRPHGRTYGTATACGAE